MLENRILRSLCYAVGVEKWIPNQPPSQLLMQAEIDAAVAIDSGYSPENFGIIDTLKMTPEIQDIINKQKMVALIKETEETNLQKAKSLTDEREEQSSQSRSAAIDAIQDAQEQHEKWLKEEHEFGGLKLTGREMQHVSQYADDNRERIMRQWSEEGIESDRAERWMEGITIMGRGGPKTAAEEKKMQTLQGDDNFDQNYQELVKESGFPAREISADAQQPGHNPASSKPSVEMSI